MSVLGKVPEWHGKFGYIRCSCRIGSIIIFIHCILIFILVSQSVSARTLNIERGSNLQASIDFASDGDTLIIGAKTFYADPVDFVDSLCGNCLEHKTPSQASYGYIIKNKSLYLIGVDRKKTILETLAGYGLYFVNSPNSNIENLTITGGRRDPDGWATDAGIVVRNSRVHISNIDIINNNHRVDSLAIGVAGIIGREGAELTIENCAIINNSWDGVALYRGASATITDCLIKDGRGAGIGVTWDATCLVYRNIISGYWKGIGAFGTSWVVAHNNCVIDNLGWGVIATEKAYMDVANNVINHNGNCGFAPWSTDCRGRVINNIITNNGWRDKWICPCVGIWNQGDWAKWEFSYNIVWNNKDGEYEDIWDQTGINGNLSIDPEFMGELIFLLKPDSPAINNGHPDISDTDGSRSDIGLYGGPQAKKIPALIQQ